MINKQNAAPTARKNSSDDQRGSLPKERAHIDLSRRSDATQSIGVEMSKQDGAAKSSGQPKKTLEKSSKIKVTSDSEVKVSSGKKAAKASSEVAIVKFEPKTAKMTGANTEGDAADKSRNTAKSSSAVVKADSVKPNRKITRFAELPASIEQSGTVSKKVSKRAESGAASKKAGKQVKVNAAKALPAETGVILRERNVDRVETTDPEIALMANRASSAERPRPDVTRMNRNRRSMSGMVVESTRLRGAGRRNATGRVGTQAIPVQEANTEGDAADGELRFSKAKSMLIGVGVALAVAIIGFIGIGLFSAKPTCVVNFESNGGSEVEATEIVCGRTVAQPDDPVKEGFSFEGWIFEGDPFDFDSGVYKNAVLVAKWKANEGTDVVTVKFDTDGGSAVRDVEVAKGKTMTMPSAPTKVGYVFEDWYLGDKVFDFATPVTSNMTLKAKWEKRQTTSSGSSSSASDSSSKPTDTKRVTRISAAGNITTEVGKSGQIILNIVPMAAEYKLSVTSSDAGVVDCSISKTVVTCTGKRAGNVTVTVRDAESGNRAQFTVTVPANDKPDVSQPETPDTPHVHKFVDGKCECGEEDPSYVPPHVHKFVDGKCECGEEDPSYVPPHVHKFVDGKCECGEEEKEPDSNPGSDPVTGGD